MPKIKKNNEISQLQLYEKRAIEYPLNSSALYRLITSNNKICITPSYCRENGLLFQYDSIAWLKLLPNECADLVFADPPYNIKKADWDTFASNDHYVDWSLEWIKEAQRILKTNGSLFICGFTEILADLKYHAMKYFNGCKWLIWYYKNKANLGSDWGRSHESILLLRKSKSFTMNIDIVRTPYNEHTLKYPSHPQAKSSQYNNDKNKNKEWLPNPLGAKPKDVIEIPTTCNGMCEKTKHPTQKPEELLRRLILSSSNPKDIIVDPFSGSGTTLVVAEQLGRYWLGCEKFEEYNKWAIERIDNVKNKDIDYWIKYDKKNIIRRFSIR